MGHTHNNVCVCKGKGVPMIIHENAGLRAYFARLIQGAFCRFASRTCWSRDLNPPARTHFRDRIPRKAPIIVSLSGANPSESAYRFAPRGGLQVQNLSVLIHDGVRHEHAGPNPAVHVVGAGEAKVRRPLEGRVLSLLENGDGPAFGASGGVAGWVSGLGHVCA